MNFSELNARTLKNLPDRLAFYRRARAYTRQQLADASGVHYDVIRRMEADNRLPRMATLSKIATALDCAIADLLVDPEATHAAK